MKMKFRMFGLWSGSSEQEWAGGQHVQGHGQRQPSSRRRRRPVAIKYMVKAKYDTIDCIYVPQKLTNSQLHLPHGTKQNRVMKKLNTTRMWAYAQRHGRTRNIQVVPSVENDEERKFHNSLPCTMPQRLAHAQCSSALE